MGLLPAVGVFLGSETGRRFYSEYLVDKSERYVECLVHGVLDFCGFVVGRLGLDDCEVGFETRRGFRRIPDVDRVFAVLRGLKRDRLADLVIEWAGRQTSASNLKNYFTGVKSWLLVNGLDLEEELPRSFQKRLHNIKRSLNRRGSILASPDFEWRPSREDVQKVFENCPTLREKALLLLLAESGLRLNTALQLRFRDFTDDKLRGFRYLMKEKPCYSIWIPRQYCGKIPADWMGHWTFIGPDARRIILEYVRARKSEKNEEITDDSFVFVVRRKTYNRADHKRTANIFNKIFRRTFKVNEVTLQNGAKRISHHLHCLRKYAQSRMEEAGLHPNLISYILGRTPRLNMGKSYSRHSLPELREAYLTALPRLIVFEKIKVENNVYTFKIKPTFDASMTLYSAMKAEIDALHRKIAALADALSAVSPEAARQLGIWRGSSEDGETIAMLAEEESVNRALAEEIYLKKKRRHQP